MRAGGYPPVGSALIFAVGVVFVALLTIPQGVTVSRPDGTLVDTDGYMRFLRVESLLEGGPWFDPINSRSNYPAGESQHWTRPIDLYVVGLVGLLGLFVEDPLPWAAAVNAPLLLMAAGVLLFRALRPLPQSLRSLAPLMLLGSIPIINYAGPGRMDHHAAILVCFVLTLWFLLRTLGDGVDSAWTLAVPMTLGLWVSTEFLVPVGLVGFTMLAWSLGSGRREVALHASRAYLGLSLGLIGVLAIERGPGWGAIEYDRVSVAHLGVALGATVFFQVLARWEGPGRRQTLSLALLLSLAIGGLLALLYPGLLAGPFSEVDPRVRELWLSTVVELQPVSAVSLQAGWMLVAPLVLGLAAGTWSISRGGRARWLITCVAWLAAYLLLTLVQLRWAMFGQVLAIPLILHLVSPLFSRLAASRLATLLRPAAVVALVFGVALVGALVPGAGGGARPPSCGVEEVAATLRGQPITTVLADQDAGPEILYRTPHRVIATPYHRNEAGILFVRDVMSLSASSPEVGNSLQQRDVGLILICPDRSDLTRPENPSGTLYEALTAGAPPDFMESVPLPAGTDYLLYAVQP